MTGLESYMIYHSEAAGEESFDNWLAFLILYNGDQALPSIDVRDSFCPRSPAPQQPLYRARLRLLQTPSTPARYPRGRLRVIRAMRG